MLGVLRDEDGERANAPAPGLADLHRLVADVRGAGVPATLHVEGPLGGVPAGVELSAYRVVQEALTNVSRHAGEATASVQLAYDARTLTVRVEDDGAGSQRPPVPGYGLVGMRERVTALGGRLRAEPGASRGFTVLAELPMNGAA